MFPQFINSTPNSITERLNHSSSNGFMWLSLRPFKNRIMAVLQGAESTLKNVYMLQTLRVGCKPHLLLLTWLFLATSLPAAENKQSIRADSKQSFSMEDKRHVWLQSEHSIFENRIYYQLTDIMIGHVGLFLFRRCRKHVIFFLREPYNNVWLCIVCFWLNVVCYPGYIRFLGTLVIFVCI